MDLRTQTSLIAAVLSLAIAATVLLRPRRRRMHWLFSFFAVSIAAWYLTTFLYRVLGTDLWIRSNLVCAVVLPVAGVQFFRAFIDEYTAWMAALHRAALVAAVTIGVFIFTPLFEHIALKAAIFTYVVLMLVAQISVVYQRGKRAVSRIEGARLRYLALVGALAATFTFADYLPLLGVDIPPVGTVLTLIFLYVLSQSILRFRLLDLYELAGRLGVLTALSFSLAFIFWIAVNLTGVGFFLPSVVAAMVVLLLFDPVRAKVEDQISQLMFRERYDLERAANDLRRRIPRALEVGELARVLIDGLEQSNRVTHAAVYFVDQRGRGYDLAASVGPPPVPRLQLVPARPLFDRLKRDDHVVLEAVERELEDAKDSGHALDAETLFEVTQVLEALHASLCLAIGGEAGEIYGLIVLRDERLRDAFTPEEIQLLRGIATQASIAIENSRVYHRIKERDRLAALGEMAAGLAHEIRNPLGAIKASAQFLEDPRDDADGRSTTEFLGIIVDEVDRLNRVVSSFLDFARPSQGNPSATDVNEAVERTFQLMSQEVSSSNIQGDLRLGPGTPAVRIDAEQLRQVIINLMRNAIQAMESGGQLTISTEGIVERDMEGKERPYAIIRVRDNGPGISAKVLSTLFVPFVTTKDGGTGLGLSISHRIVTSAGGSIDVTSEEGAGAVFTVKFPSAGDASVHQSSPFGEPEVLAEGDGAIETASRTMAKR